MPRTSQDRYRESRHAKPRPAVRPVGPAAAFGRGRALMAAVMLFLVATAYLLHSRDGVALSGGAESSAVVALWDPSQRDAIVAAHGGILDDPRAQAIQQVGQKLVSVIEPPFQDGLRFGLLADDARPESYAFRDGTIFVTLGLARLTEYESEVAAALCAGLEQVIRARNAAASTVPAGRLSAVWMQRAGFNPRDLEILRQRIAARTVGRPAS